jgi:TolA-binding protein
LSDQQSKISMAVAPLGSQMDALAQSVNALTQTVSQMNGRMGSMDGRVKDLSDKVSLLNQPAPAPPPAAVVSAPDPSAGTSGVSRLSLRQDAELDYSTGHDDQAKMEFSNYIKTYPQDEYAPTAGYYLGMLFLREKNYDDAAQAFQDVIDHYQGNNKAQDALYQKGMALELGAHKKEAIAAFNEFLMSFPANDYAPQARKELAKLTAPANSKNKAKGAPK